MPGDIPMYKKEEKNSQTHMLDTKNTYYQLAQYFELLPIKQLKW